MTLPTAEEIQAAHADVESEGAASETTVGLAQIALTDPHLKGFIDNVCGALETVARDRESGKVTAEHEAVIRRSTLIGTLIGGLNLGVRIGEARFTVERDGEDLPE